MSEPFCISFKQIVSKTFLHVDPKYNCAFNRLHVKDAAYLIALIGIAYFGASFIIFGFNAPQIDLEQDNNTLKRIHYATSGSDLFLTLIAILVCACIIYTDKTGKPWGYLPYLFYFGIVIGVVTCSAILILIGAVLGAWEFSFELDGDLWKFVKDVLLRFEILLILYDSIMIYFWYIVFKAYNYMLMMNKEKNSTNFMEQSPSNEQENLLDEHGNKKIN